jgi:uncharacterized protein YdeI (YjbR/CyaY-like superfamily)
VNPKVDEFIDAAEQWREELGALRKIILACRLSEELKWGVPCYTLNGKNVVLIHGFKDYCAILFVKGALLKDDKGLLVAQTENVQASRQIRFSELRQVIKLKADIKAYVQEAAELEKAGLKVSFKNTADFPVPEEFRRALDADGALRIAFDALTPGRQRAYLLHFSQAKQAQTRESRIAKCAPLILAGKGLNDE